MFKDLFRFIQILNILFKARLDSLIREYSSSKWIAIFYLSPWQVFSSKKPRGERIFQALEEAGPIFIKFGRAPTTDSIFNLFKPFLIFWIIFQYFYALRIILKKPNHKSR